MHAWSPLLLVPVLALAPQAAGQEGAVQDPAAESTAEVTPRETATHLKERIHDLRGALLGGGRKVQEAEEEAITFYRREFNDYAAEVSELEGDTISTRTDYERLLEDVLGEADPERQAALARKARRKKGELAELEEQRRDLLAQRDLAGEMVNTLQNRMEDRRKLLADFEAGRDPERHLFLAPGIFRPAPADRAAEGEAFDRELLRDLAVKDPERARALIAETDPVLYLELWPLVPPPGLFAEVLVFPPPDPPGSR
jgi:hypothetical protein